MGCNVPFLERPSTAPLIPRWRWIILRSPSFLLFTICKALELGKRGLRDALAGQDGLVFGLGHGLLGQERLEALQVGLRLIQDGGGLIQTRPDLARIQLDEQFA